MHFSKLIMTSGEDNLIFAVEIWFLPDVSFRENFAWPPISTRKWLLLILGAPQNTNLEELVVSQVSLNADPKEAWQFFEVTFDLDPKNLDAFWSSHWKRYEKLSGPSLLPIFLLKRCRVLVTGPCSEGAQMYKGMKNLPDKIALAW